MSKKWVKVGTIYKGKVRDDGSSNNYIKIDAREGATELGSVTLKTGQTLSCFNPRKRKGITDAELAKIPDYVLADIMIGPDKD